MEFFWSVFSRIWTEYGEIRSIRSECGKIRTKKTPDTDNFYAVVGSIRVSLFSRKIAKVTKTYEIFVCACLYFIKIYGSNCPELFQRITDLVIFDNSPRNICDGVFTLINKLEFTTDVFFGVSDIWMSSYVCQGSW